MSRKALAVLAVAVAVVGLVGLLHPGPVLRGIANVRTEWSLLATAFNLRTLCRVWRIRTAARSAFI